MGDTSNVRRAVAISVVLALAGCGGGARVSKTTFEQHLKKDAVTAAKALTNASTGAGHGNAAYIRRLRFAQSELANAADDLDELRPPADAEADTKTVVKTLRYFVRQLKTLQHAAETHDSEEARAVSKAIGESAELKAFTAAIKDLQGKGYDVGVFRTRG
jgi:hypothetical protein